MGDADLHIRCQRCGAEMEMRDPGPGVPALLTLASLGRPRVRRFVTLRSRPQPAEIPWDIPGGSERRAWGYANRDNCTAPDRQGLRLHPRRKRNRTLLPPQLRA